MKNKLAKNLVLLLITGVLLSCSSTSIELKQFKEEVKIHTDLQDEFLNDNYGAIGVYASGVAELSKPKPVELSWKVKKQEKANYTVKISEDKDLNHPIIIKTSELSASVYNLKIGTKYYWNVRADYESTSDTSETETFEIESYGPRNLYVDGVTNVRDVGGWPIDETHRVKQGLFYRSGRLNTSESKTIIKEVTSEGEKVLLDDLKIKSEMDLRLVDNNEVGSITSSVLGDEVTYFSCPMDWNNSNILTHNTEMIKHIFSDILAKEENYPIIFHCNIGTDRTGLIAYLLNGLLGVSEDNLYYDYLFSNFGLIGGARTTNNIKSYVGTIKGTDGNSLSDKINNYLLSIGISSNDISAIKNLFIESI
ncbi:MAG: tyrosine-protein phosphatase [Erysipelotrichales bacterium]|nr:tyrosine-protein phosphatase [Erysipelotrichales bacterium]